METLRIVRNETFLFRSPSNGIIHDAIAADFDGDSKLDLFILYKTSADQRGYRGGISWGDRVKLGSFVLSARSHHNECLDEIQSIGYLFENIPTTIE